MPSAEQITQTVNCYLELAGGGSADDIADLYTADATVEDPVGGEVHIGRQAIHGFYANIEGLQRKSELVALRVSGNEAAYLWKLTVNMGDNSMLIEPINVMTFDDDAKITSMKSYWSPENVTQL